MLRLLRRGDEGGSVVEFAITSALLVPMVVYAIYAGEALVAATQAQEAEITAGWEMTSYLTHAYNGGSAADMLSKAADRAKKTIEKDLKDLDAFDTANSRTGYTGVWGQTKLGTLTCGARTGGPEFAGTDNYLHADGFAGCAINVTYENKKSPTQMHADFFKNPPKVIQDSFKKMTLCGNGENLSGCKPEPGRGFVVMTDDWGLENSNQNEVGTQQNTEYYNPGSEVFESMVGTAAQVTLNATFLLMIGREDQGETNTFKMGYYKTIATKRSFSSEGGTMKVHLSTEHEKASDANNDTANLSKDMYNSARKKDYLAKDPDWNKP